MMRGGRHHVYPFAFHLANSAAPGNFLPAQIDQVDAPRISDVAARVGVEDNEIGDLADRERAGSVSPRFPAEFLVPITMPRWI